LSSCYELFFLRSAHRFFIAIERRRLPSGVRPPRLLFLVALPLGLPTRFLPLPPDKADPADPNRALIARPSLSLSFAKSATNLSRSKVRSFGVHAYTQLALFVGIQVLHIGVHAYSYQRNTPSFEGSTDHSGISKNFAARNARRER
jgi:hypothetical protein